MHTSVKAYPKEMGENGSVKLSVKMIGCKEIGESMQASMSTEKARRHRLRAESCPVLDLLPSILPLEKSA